MAKLCFIALLFTTLFTGGDAGAAGVLNSVAKKLQRTSVAFGTFSRSKIVAAVSKQLRGEEGESVRESLNQAIVTLAVLDLGGGVLVPFTEHIIDVISKDALFTVTADAWHNYNTVLYNKLKGNLDNLDDDAVKFALNVEKKKILSQFDDDVAELQRVRPQSKTIKHLNKAKRWLKVKSIGKVLGPLFDIIGIGVNAWALDSALKACENPESPDCNLGSVAAATLSIASGVVGLGTFVASLFVASSVLGPVGAIISFALALGATLIELFYRQPKNQAVIERQRRYEMMRELDRYSRVQLYTANKFFTDNKIDRSDLYVANQGHMPHWFRYESSITTKFGMWTAARPRKKNPLIQLCSTPVFGDADVPTGPGPPGKPPPTPHECPYLIDGYQLGTEGDNPESLGYGLYGFTKNARSYEAGQKESLGRDAPYAGSIVLVPTDQVQPEKLSALNMNAKLRGLYIRTDYKSGTTTPYDDIIAVGNMKSLKSGERIFIRMGSGNDALNIDGMFGEFSSAFVNILDADLGLPGHNSLNFHAIAAGSPIKGINYDAQTGRLEYYHGSRGTSKHHVGKILNVEILEASPYKDTIKLYAARRGDAGVDFTVIKYKGHGTYTIDMALLRRMTETRHFKIIDSTDNRRTTDKCNNHVPVLKLTNFGGDAVENDVQYKEEKIFVYGTRQRASGKKTFRAWLQQKASRFEKKTTVCSGEPADGSHPEGGEINGKVLLATIGMYTKCPAEIRTTTTSGRCMMSPRPITELDLKSFQGKRFIADFTRDYAGSDGADYVTLKCPTQVVNRGTNLNLGRGSRDYVVLRSDLFLDPCEFDGEGSTFVLEKDPVRRSYWTLRITVDEDVHFTGAGKSHVLKGVDKIINEYGELIADLKKTDATTIQLYDLYAEKTMRDIGALTEKERSEELKDNMLVCLENVENPTEEQTELCNASSG